MAQAKVALTTTKMPDRASSQLQSNTAEAIRKLNKKVDDSLSSTSTGTGDGDSKATYLVVAATASLPNARVITAGNNVSIADISGTLVVSATGGSSGGGADPGASYVVLANTSSLPNERALSVNSGLVLTDGGPGGNASLGIDTNVVVTQTQLSSAMSSVTASISSALSPFQPVPYHVPSMLNWTTSTASLPATANGTFAYILGSTIYLHGVGTSGLIYTASVNKPEEFASSGRNVCNTGGSPVTNVNTQRAGFFVVSSSMYIVQGAHIASASIADPLNWSTASMNLSFNFPYAQMHVVGNRAWSFGGDVGATTTATNNIYSSSFGNLTKWDVAVASGLKGGPIKEQASFAFKGRIFSAGGINDVGNGNTELIYCEESDPMTWYDSGITFPVAMCDPIPVVVDDKIYLIGVTPTPGTTPSQTVIFSSDGFNWLAINSVLPTAVTWTKPLILSGTVYLYGGALGSSRTSTATIWKTKAMLSGTTVSGLPTYPSGTFGTMGSGYPSFLSMQQRVGGLESSKFLSSNVFNTST